MPGQGGANSSEHLRPLDQKLPWLVRRPRGKEVIGVVCLYAECTQVVPWKKGRGRPSAYCRTEHREAARARREDLLSRIAQINGILGVPGRVEGSRRQLAQELRFLETVLGAYPSLRGGGRPRSTRSTDEGDHVPD